MSGIPVVVSNNGFGLPVKQVNSGAPVMTVATNGRGIPIVLSSRGLPFVVQGLGPPTLATLTLSGTLRNGVSSSGSIFGATSGSTITSNVTGLTVNSGARTYTFDGTGAAGTTANGLVETLVGATGSPKNSSITVAAAYVLGTLTLSGILTNGTASSGTIIGATTGSTITSNVTGLTVNSGARTYSFDGSASAGTTANGLVETLTGATGSPKNNSITVASGAGAPADPVTSNMSSGWTSGDNPPNWDTTYSGIYYDPSDFTGDGLRIRYKFAGAGSYTTLPWIPFDVAYLVDGFTYPFLTDGTLNAGGAFEVQVQAGRDFSGAIDGVSTSATPTSTSNWSNTWSDTLNPVAVAKWSYNAAPAVQTLSFGDPAAVTFTNQTFGVGTAVVGVINQGQRGVPTAVTVNGAACTKRGQVVDSNDAISEWNVANGTATTTATVVVTYGTNINAATVCIATGTLAASINPVPAATSTVPVSAVNDPQASASFTLPANGVAHAIWGVIGNGVTPTWGIGTANAERHGANGDFMFAAGSLLGGASSSTAHFEVNGFAYAGSMALVVVYGP